MLCARLIRPGELSLTREEIPQPTPDRPLIKVSAVGLCGSDAHWYEHGSTDDTKLEQPLILGHGFRGHGRDRLMGRSKGRSRSSGPLPVVRCMCRRPGAPLPECRVCRAWTKRRRVARLFDLAGTVPGAAPRRVDRCRGGSTRTARCLPPRHRPGAETAAHTGPVAIGGGLRFRADRAAPDRCTPIVRAFQCHCH